MVFGKVRNQRGAGNIGCLFMLIIVGAGLYAGFQIAMPRVRNTSFEDRVNESLGNLRQMKAEEAQKQLIQFASEFDIALTPAQVQVSNVGQRLKIDIAYEKVVDLKFWQQTVPFHIVRNPAP